MPEYHKNGDYIQRLFLYAFIFSLNLNLHFDDIHFLERMLQGKAFDFSSIFLFSNKGILVLCYQIY
jgi:hypothetical protein